MNTRPVPALRLWFVAMLLSSGLPAGHAAAGASNVSSDRPFLSPMFGDNMVLQRGKPNRMWGWCETGAEVSVTVEDRTSSTLADNDGRWEVTFEPPPVGGPYSVTIEGPEAVELANVLVGDVWLCGGQSNMVFGLGSTKNGPEEVKAADFPEIRMFAVPQQSAYSPATVLGGTWEVCSPGTDGRGGVARFSAVAYFFGRRLHQELGVPIGLIRDCVGGSRVECWMSPDALGQFDEFGEKTEAIARLRGNVEREYGSFLMHWLDDHDVGLQGEPWYATDLDDSGWNPVTIPGGIRELGMADFPSVCWFRLEVDLPDPLPEGRARIFLGSVEKMDTTYINSEWVGASSWVENPRRYFVSEDVLRPGRNVVTVRVFTRGAGGGFVSDPDDLRIELGDGSSIPLAGEWKGRLSVDARSPHPLPLGFENYPTMPTVMYHGMIAPVAPLAIRGALWYQGEANFEQAFQYRSLLPALIADWRRLFGQGDFPFYVVSLPSFMARRDTPGDDSWAELREAQALTAENVPNTALAVTVDTGDADDIHPRDKLPVGERLALCALGQEFGKDVVWKGPTFASLDVLPGELRVYFENTDGGLVVNGDELGEFSVAGNDRKWHWADASIIDGSVVVSSPDVPDPVAVRYAWQANPQATLFNGAGLPAVPFRSDVWPGITEDQ